MHDCGGKEYLKDVLKRLLLRLIQLHKPTIKRHVWIAFRNRQTKVFFIFHDATPSQLICVKVKSHLVKA